jgi:PA domain
MELSLSQPQTSGKNYHKLTRAIPYGHHLSGTILLSDPVTACSAINMPPRLSTDIIFVLVMRGDCDFTDKVYNAQIGGAAAVIVIDTLN